VVWVHACVQAIVGPFLQDKHREGAMICDAVAMAVALSPEVVTRSYEKFVDVELRGFYTR
jgi:inosine-uridine nucleoside N-ribohydrolase